jgi:hypothetical protein
MSFEQLLYKPATIFIFTETGSIFSLFCAAGSIKETSFRFWSLHVHARAYIVYKYCELNI